MSNPNIHGMFILEASSTFADWKTFSSNIGDIWEVVDKVMVSVADTAPL